MRFRGEVHHRIDARQQRVEQTRIADVPMHELIPWRVGDWSEILEVAGVGEGVEYHHFGAFEADIGILEGAANKVRADEAGATGNEYFHRRVLFS